MTLTRRLPSRRFLSFTALLCLVPLAIAWWRRPAPLPPAKPYRFPTRELADLDREVQVRFAVVPDKDFGIGRIGPRHGYFSPLTAGEKAVVADLQKAKTEVVFYVVGRNTILKQRNWLSFSPVQGPVYITPHQRVNSVPEVGYYGYQVRFYSPDGVPKDVPDDDQLVDVAKPVLNDATLRLGTDTKINSWNVVARRVEASSQACVDCHNSRAPWKTPDRQTSWSLSRSATHDIVSLHDPLGVALYCYRPARKVQLKKLSGDDLEALKPVSPDLSAKRHE